MCNICEYIGSPIVLQDICDTFETTHHCETIYSAIQEAHFSDDGALVGHQYVLINLKVVLYNIFCPKNKTVL